LPSPTITEINSVNCIGREEGDERITVQVLDQSNAIVAETFYDFEITPVFLGCFQQSKIIYQRGLSFIVANADGSNEDVLFNADATSMNISPNGQWFAWNEYTDIEGSLPNFSMHIQDCERNLEEIQIPGGLVGDDSPEFSEDSKFLYFLRVNPAQDPLNVNPSSRYQDIASYNIETGEVLFLTSYYLQQGRVIAFTVNRNTGEIALILNNNYRNTASGGLIWDSYLVFLNPETGNLETSISLPPTNTAANGLDWSPDGQELIFSLATADSGLGLYSFDVQEGSQLVKVLDWFQAPLYPHFNSDGSRIFWGGKLQSEQDQNKINILSVNRNGEDLQKVTDYNDILFFQGVLK